MKTYNSTMARLAHHTNPLVRMPFIALVGFPILAALIVSEVASDAASSVKEVAPLCGDMWRLMIHGPKRGA